MEKLIKARDLLQGVYNKIETTEDYDRRLKEIIDLLDDAIDECADRPLSQAEEYELFKDD